MPAKCVSIHLNKVGGASGAEIVRFRFLLRSPPPPAAAAAAAETINKAGMKV